MWRRHGVFLKGLAVAQGVDNGGAIGVGNGIYLRVVRQVHGYEAQRCYVLWEKHAQGAFLCVIMTTEVYSRQIAGIVDDSREFGGADRGARCQGGCEIAYLGVVEENAFGGDVLVLGLAAWTRGRLEGNHAISGIGDGGIHLLVYAAVQLVVFLDVVAHLQLSILLEKGIDIAAMSYYHLVICCLGTQQVTAKCQRKDDKSNSFKFSFECPGRHFFKGFQPWALSSNS